MAKRKSKSTSTVTYYPSFQAMADATHAMAIQNKTDNDHTDNNPTPEIDDLGIRSAADFPRQPVEWLWPQKIPLGKVTLLIGDPGLGKSLIALDIASRVTTGAPFPNATSNPFASSATTNHTEHAPNTTALNPEPQTLNPPSSMLLAPSSVLILTAEDEIADTIRPRLDAHGADPARVFFASSLTDLRRDRDKLAAVLDRIPDCRLIVVDPVNAFVGPSDSHFHTVVRKVLAPLAELAAERRIAILAVTHLRKNTGRAIQSAAGSMGFVAAARSVWTVCRDPADATRNLLLPVKNNVGPLSPGLAYTIETHAELNAPIINWQAEPIANTAEDIVESATKSRGPEAEDRRQAGEWLKTSLAAGPRDSWFVLQEAHQHGFSDRTLRRALHAIGGITRKETFDAGWVWSLPEMSQPDPPRPDTKSSPSPSPPRPPDAKQPGPFDETWPLREDPEKSNSPGLPPAPPSPPSALDCVDATIAESIKYLTRLDAQHKPPDFKVDANHPPPTDHAKLDQLLTNFRNSLRSLPPSIAQIDAPAQKKVPGAIPVSTREPTPGTLAQRTLASPERCISATFPPLCGTSPTHGAAEMPINS